MATEKKQKLAEECPVCFLPIEEGVFCSATLSRHRHQVCLDCFSSKVQSVCPICKVPDDRTPDDRRKHLIRLTELETTSDEDLKEVYTQLAALVPSGIPYNTLDTVAWFRRESLVEWAADLFFSHPNWSGSEYCYLLITFVTEYPDKKLVARVLDRHVVHMAESAIKIPTMPLRLLLEKYDCRGMSDLTWQLMLCIYRQGGLSKHAIKAKHLLVWSRGILPWARMLRLFEWAGVFPTETDVKEAAEEIYRSPFPLNEETAVELAKINQAAVSSVLASQVGYLFKFSLESIRAISSGMEIRMFNVLGYRNRLEVMQMACRIRANFSRELSTIVVSIETGHWDILPLFQWTNYLANGSKDFQILQCAVVDVIFRSTDRLLEEKNPAAHKVAYRALPGALDNERFKITVQTKLKKWKVQVVSANNGISPLFVCDMLNPPKHGDCFRNVELEIINH